MDREDGRYALLYLCVDVHHDRAAALEPFKGDIILLLELPLDLIYRENDSAPRSGLHLRPDCREHVGRVIAKEIQNATGVNAVSHYSPWPTSSEPL